MFKKILALLGVLTFSFSLAACGGDSEPTDLTGTWMTTGDTKMAAVVTSDQITINITDGDGLEALYWVGTFDSTKAGNQTSQADTEQLEASLFGSGDSKKDFKASNDSITFKFTAMGVTQDLKLVRFNG